MRNDRIMKALEYLIAAAAQDNPGGFDLNLAIGEVEINGQRYQLAYTLLSDEKDWLPPGEIVMSTLAARDDVSIDEFIKSYIKKK